jgi:hypothetical protein
MAVTATPSGNAPGRGGYGRPLFVRGNQRFGCVPYFIDLDNSYPTGGYDITAIFNEFKLETNAANIMLIVQSRMGYVFDVDYTNKKLLAYRQSAATSALTEVANAVNLSAITQIRCLAFGPLG